MPELNGFDVLKLIRSDDKYNDLQIIMFTSLNDTESFKMCFELGASDFINSLRSFSRTVEEDKKDSFNLKEVINQVILITRNEVKYIANLEIDVSDDIEVYINKGQIGQVLINIIMNATQAIQALAQKDLGKLRFTH